MARAALTLFCLAACGGSAAGQAGTKHLISTDLIYDTYELLHTAYSTVWAKADIDSLLAKVPVDDAKKEAWKLYDQLYTQLPPAAQQAITTAQVQSVQIKALVAENVEKARTQADEIAHAVITKLESEVSMFKGLVKKSAGDAVLFVCYVSFVLYMILKVTFFVFNLALGIFCCFCCCGCCRSRKKAKASADKNGKAKAAASKGKAAAAAASNGKAAAAPKPKSKK